MITTEQLNAWWAEQDPCGNGPAAFVMSGLQYVVSRAGIGVEREDVDEFIAAAEQRGFLKALVEAEDLHADIEQERAHRRRAEQSEVEARAELAILRADVAAMKRGDIFTRARRRVSMILRDE